MDKLGIKVKLIPDGNNQDFQKAVDELTPKVKVNIDKASIAEQIKEALSSAKVKNFTIPLKAVIDTKGLSKDLQKALGTISIQNASSTLTKRVAQSTKNPYIEEYQKNKKYVEELYAKVADLRKLSTNKDTAPLADRKSITNAERMLDILQQLSVHSTEYKKTIGEASYVVERAMRKNKAAIDKSFDISDFSISKERISKYQSSILKQREHADKIREGKLYDQAAMDDFSRQLAFTQKLQVGTEQWEKSVIQLNSSYATLKQTTSDLFAYTDKLNALKNNEAVMSARGIASSSELSSLSEQIQEIEQLQAGTDTWKRSIEEADALYRNIRAQTSQINAEQAKQNSRTSAATHSNNIFSQVSGILQKNPRIKENIALFEEFKRIQDEALSIDSTDTNGWRNLSEDLSRANQRMHELGLSTETLGQRLVRLFKDHFNTAVAMAALHALQNALMGVYQNVLDVDRAMTDLRKVSTGTTAQYNDFLSGAAARAETLGATISDVIDASAEFSRLGFNLNESSVLGDAAVLYKNVSEYEDIGEAAQSIVSTMQAFGIAAGDVMSIVDRFNEIGKPVA